VHEIPGRQPRASAPRLQTELPLAARVRSRLPVQALTVAGGLVSAWILRHLLGEPGPSIGNADLLRYVPIIIGLAANVGIQTATVLVRGFATGEVPRERERAAALGEIATGVVMAALVAAATVLVAGFVEGGHAAARRLLVSVGVAVFVCVSWASALACAIPIACRRAGWDPAIAAGPFLIALSDVSSAALYLVVARALADLGAAA
jgi:magnesium transporter